MGNVLLNYKAKFKNNYLTNTLSSAIKKIYNRKEYDLYNDLREIYDNKGELSDDDIYGAIREYRTDVAKSLFSVVGREYKPMETMANEIYSELFRDNYEDMQKKGITISCAYLTVAKCIVGDSAEEDVDINELAAPLMNEFDELERNSLMNSLEIMQEDGIIKDAEKYVK